MQFAKRFGGVQALDLRKRYRQLLGGLSIAGMAWLLALLAVVPLAGVLGVHMVGQWREVAHLARASDGARVVGDLLHAQAALMQAADLRQRLGAGESGLGGEQAAVRQALQAAVRQIETTQQATRSHARLGDWEPQAHRLIGLLGEAARGGEVRPAALASLDRLPALAAEQSGLLNLRAGPPSALGHVRVHGLGRWLGALSELRGEGAVALATGEPDAAARAAMLVRAEVLGHALNDVQLSIEQLTRAGAAPLAQWQPAWAASQRLAALTREQFGAAGGAYGAGAYAAEATAAASAVLALDGELARLLQAELDAGMRHARWSFALALLGGVLSALAVAVVVRTYAQGLRHVGQVLQGSLAAVAAGDLSGQVPLRGQDALAGAAREVEHMTGRLSALVAEIRSSAVRISQAGQTVAEDGHALTGRTELQAQSLSQSVEVAERLEASVAANAEAARTLNALTDRLREQLEAGGQVVDQTEQSILSLQDSTRRVAEINQVIDDIAFQTNLLALNASVEAARAGEAGRGFAVVAAEVRQLAQRCAGAAAEVRSLIDQTTMQVDEATSHIQETTALLSRVGGGVQEVARRIDVLAGATAEQSHSLTEVRESIASLNSITVENSGALVRSTGAAQALAEQAEALKRAVSTMRLRQGTADEAQAKVQRALAHIDAVGFEAAADEFNRAEGPWIDRDLFLFAVDDHNRYTVAGGRPDWLGLSTFDLPGVTHVQAETFLREASRITEAGGSWIEYLGTHPETLVQVAKTAFIAPLAGGGFIGCAVYRQASDPTPAGAPSLDAALPAPGQAVPASA